MADTRYVSCLCVCLCVCEWVCMCLGAYTIARMIRIQKRRGPRARQNDYIAIFLISLRSFLFVQAILRLLLSVERKKIPVSYFLPLLRCFNYHIRLASSLFFYVPFIRHSFVSTNLGESGPRDSNIRIDHSFSTTCTIHDRLYRKRQRRQYVQTGFVANY